MCRVKCIASYNSLTTSEKSATLVPALNIFRCTIRFVAGYGGQYGRNTSCLGQKVLFCMRHFQFSTYGIVCDNFFTDRLVNLKYMESVSDELERSVDMLRECVRIRVCRLTLPGEFCDAVNDIICFLCTD